MTYEEFDQRLHVLLNELPTMEESIGFVGLLLTKTKEQFFVAGYAEPVDLLASANCTIRAEIERIMLDQVPECLD